MNDALLVNWDLGDAKTASEKETLTPQKIALRLPDLDQVKTAVLNTLTSVDGQLGCRHAIDEFR